MIINWKTTKPKDMPNYWKNFDAIFRKENKCTVMIDQCIAANEKQQTKKEENENKSKTKSR